MSELKFLSFSLILYAREIQILALQTNSIYKGLKFSLHCQDYTFYQQHLPKSLSTHHCAGSKRLFLQTFQMYLSLNARQFFHYSSHILRTCPFDYQLPLKRLIVRLVLVSIYLCTDDVLWWKFRDPKWWSRWSEVHLASKLFLLSSWKRIHHKQRANVSQWSLSVAQNYAMEWCHCFFKKCSFEWKVLFVESYLHDSCWFIIMKWLLANTSWIQSPSKISTAH